MLNVIAKTSASDNKMEIHLFISKTPFCSVDRRKRKIVLPMMQETENPVKKHLTGFFYILFYGVYNAI